MAGNKSLRPSLSSEDRNLNRNGCRHTIPNTKRVKRHNSNFFIGIIYFVDNIFEFCRRTAFQEEYWCHYDYKTHEALRIKFFYFLKKFMHGSVENPKRKKIDCCWRLGLQNDTECRPVIETLNHNFLYTTCKFWIFIRMSKSNH